MAAAGAGDDEARAPPMVKMVDMPVEYLRWVLAQDKESYRVPTLDDFSPEELAEPGSRETILAVVGSLQTAYDDFAAFRAWVRAALDKDGRVMIRQDMLFMDPQEWQEIVDDEWAAARQELELELEDDDDMEPIRGRPLGPHTYMLSTYLSLIYEYAAPVPTFWDS